MIELKDIVQLWLKTNKNISRSWELIEDNGGVWVLQPRWPKHYKKNSRVVMLVDCVKMHYDDDEVFMDKGCHSENVMAYDQEFFQKLVKWLRFVRRR